MTCENNTLDDDDNTSAYYIILSYSSSVGIRTLRFNCQT